jgi:fused signal recognition particle receptor
MFKFLKDKIRNWTKKVTKSEEEKEIAVASKKKEPKPKEKKIKSKKEKPKEIEVPLKVNYPAIEPDIEYLEKEIEKKLHEEGSEESEKPGGEGFFKRITSRISKVKISENDFEVYGEELEMLLLENNVALEVAEKMIKELKERIVDKEFLKKEIEGQIQESFKDIIREILIRPFDVSQRIKGKMAGKDKSPYVILFCGINGTGKTTTIAKIAEWLKNRDITSVIAAADTFRAASIEQLNEHGEKLGIKVISGNYGSDPASVAFDAIKYAKKNSISCVLIDTAGRMHTEKNLLKEMEKIVRVTKPDLKVFVGESITGNDAVEQIKSFDWAIGIDGIVLTKADIDEKGGTALSLGYITKKPILFLGTGQTYDAIEPFDKEKFIERLGL